MALFVDGFKVQPVVEGPLTETTVTARPDPWCESLHRYRLGWSESLHPTELPGAICPTTSERRGLRGAAFSTRAGVA